MPMTRNSLYMKAYNEKCREIYKREFRLMYKKVLSETGDPGEAHQQAHDWAKEFPDDEARDYAEACIEDFK